jgi:WD40 repeat protein
MSAQSLSEQSVFLAAIEKRTSAERAAYLDHVCPANSTLRSNVEELLAAHDRLNPIPPPPAADATTPAKPEELRLDFLSPAQKTGSLGRLGHYEILEVIGQGGMGVVLKACDEKLRRIVAVKAMLPALATSATARQRFIREAQAAAAVRNEHVIDIHAVEEENGLPYLVMEYISGIALQERLDRSRLKLNEILRIGMQTARGLAAAHAQGLVHRDVKPANILLENGVERVKITDFGLARTVDDASLTQSGIIAGTPHYMSPEQARGEHVDHRADLFGLGSLLYVMCTGRPPFRAENTMAVLKRVCEDAPHGIRELNPDIPDWLAATVTRLHAKDPAGRLQSAAEVAQQLEQGLAHLHQPSAVPAPAVPGARAATSRQRRWWIAAAVLLSAAALLALPHVLERMRGKDAASLGERKEDDLGATTITEVRRFDGGHTNHIVALAFSPDGKQAASAAQDHSIRVWDVESGKELRVLEGHTDTVVGVAFAKGGLRLLSAGRDKTVRLWDLQTGSELRQLGDNRSEELRNVAVSPDGRFGLTAEADKTVRLWDLDNGNELRQFVGHEAPVYDIAFSRNGDRILSGSADRTMRLWDTQTGQELKRFKGHAAVVHGVAFSADDRRAASASWDGTVRLWDALSGRELKVYRCAESQCHRVVFTPDGRRLLATCHEPEASDRFLRMWDVESGNSVTHVGGAWGWCPLALSRDGGFALTATADYRVRLLRLSAGEAPPVQARLLATLEGHASVGSLAFHPLDNILASAGAHGDHTIKLWDLTTEKELASLSGHTGQIIVLAFTPDGTTLASASLDHTVRFWDVAARKEREPALLHPNMVWALGFSPDGKTFATAGSEFVAKLWDVKTGVEEATLATGNGARALAFAPKAKLLAVTMGSVNDPKVQLWDLETREMRPPLPVGHSRGPECVAFDPDGAILATGGHDRTVILWDAAKGKKLKTLYHDNLVQGVAFSRDGQILASCDGLYTRPEEPGAVKLWDVATRKELHTLPHPGCVYGVAFAPRGNTLATACADGVIRLWEVSR